jgi:gamma-glutamyl hydrolase
VLRPGHAFFDTASALVDAALAANDAGDYFPVSDGCVSAWVAE